MAALLALIHTHKNAFQFKKLQNILHTHKNFPHERVKSFLHLCGTYTLFDLVSPLLFKFQADLNIIAWL